jgi:hypothetical protein
MHCGFVSSVDEVLNCNHSEYLTSYVDKEAIHIHQTCYHDTRYFSFKNMDYDGPDSMRGMTGMILSYDNICHQYNVVINIMQKSFNGRTSMCSIPKCYGASKPASKRDELVKLPSQQVFEEIKSRCCQVKLSMSNS